jgi:hypothetical protein
MTSLQCQHHDVKTAGYSEPLQLRLSAVLQPVLLLFHSLLTDSDAARLLRSSRNLALSLLPCYTFTSHVFQPASLASLRRLRDLCTTYSIRITQLCLPSNIKTLPFDLALPHLSPIPPSVTALTLGPLATCKGGVNRRWTALSAAACYWQNRKPWCPPPQDPPERADSQHWQLTWTVDTPDELDPFLPWFPDTCDDLEEPVPAGVLPEGLRVLRFRQSNNHPLQPGSLPSTLTFLQPVLIRSAAIAGIAASLAAVPVFIVGQS